jgi:hypothetical protein
MAKPRVQWLTNFSKRSIANASPGSARAAVGDRVELDLNPFGLEATVSGPGAPERVYTKATVIHTQFDSAGEYTWTVTNADGAMSATITIV